jgi:DNA-binding CsgD family transcriptional regulator
MEILRLVATGAANQEIAQKLFISVNTVKVHLRNIFFKLEVTSRTEATMVAVRRGWVEVPQAAAPGVPGESGPDGESPETQRDDVPAPHPPLVAPPVLERWPRVHWIKRAILAASLALALAALFLPRALLGQARGPAPSALSGLLPTPTAVAGPTSGRWHTRAQMPTPRHGLAVVAQGDLVYAIGGISSTGVTGKVEVYDPAADSWTAGTAMRTPAGFVSAAVVGGQIFVPGGIGIDQRALDILEVYDPMQDNWDGRAPMPEPLAGYALAALDDQLYLFGGLSEQGYVTSAYSYDPALDRWQAHTPMPEARGLLGAAVLQDRIYVVGGYNDDQEFNACDIYTPATDSWAPCRPMSLRRGGLVLVAVRNNLYAIGGGMEGYLAFNERYDPRLDVWGRIETPVAGQWRGLGAAFVDPYLYAVGGWNGGSLSVNEAYKAMFYQILTVP